MSDEVVIEQGIDLSDSPTLALFYKSNAPMRCIVGPVGSGKSSICCVEIVRRACETPAQHDKVRRSRWAVVRNTYVELRDTTIKTFKQWVNADYFGRWHESSHTFIMSFNAGDGTRVEAEVLFRALDRPEDVRKLLSLELTGCYFNEWREIPWNVVEMMDTRVGRYPRKDDVPEGCWTGIFGDTNPPDDDHWIYKKFEEERPEGFELFKQPSGRSAKAENREHLVTCPGAKHPTYERDPTSGEWKRIKDDSKHLSPCVCYYEKSARGKGKDFVKVMIDAEYGSMFDGKPIFPEYIDGQHTAKEAIPILRSAHITIGNDYGLTPAAVWLQRDPQDGQIQVVREFVSPRMGAVNFGAEQLRICKSEFRDNTFEGFGDPAGMQEAQTDERTPIEIVNAAGVPMAAASTNDLEIRWETVRGLLLRNTWRGRPMLVISPSCKWLRKAMKGGYQLKRLQVSGEDRYQSAPIKNEFSHVAEALQYALLGLGEDRTVLDGGQPNRVYASIRVKRAVGGPTIARRGFEDDDDQPRRFGVKRSVR